MDFIDTNIVVYANDNRDAVKHSRACDIIETAMLNRSATISSQVLFEYANVAFSKLNQAHSAVHQQVKSLSILPVVLPTPTLVMRALEIRDVYQISLWDAGIVAAAEIGGCARILSEDLGSNQYYCGIQVVNPFLQ
jgi:predicted nucleic acid-binding protein